MSLSNGAVGLGRKAGGPGLGTVQENGFNAVILDDFSKLFPNFSK